MYHRGNVGFNREPAYFVVWLFVLCCMFCAVSSAYGEDFDALLMKANRGDAEAQVKVGEMYFDGEGVRQDYKKALEYFEKAAALNNAGASAYLGYVYEHGLGVKRDYRKAREYYEKARESLEKAAAWNNAGALNDLGYIYQQGYGVKQDYKKAREYYEKAAALNFPRAFYNLGYMYEQGQGVKQDYNKTREWYAQGVEKGDPNCKLSLARMNENGIGTKKDTKKAVDLYQQAAADGNKQAQKALTRLKIPQKTPANTTAQKQSSIPSPNDTASANSLAIVKPRLAVMNFEDKSEQGNAPADAIMNMMVTELFKSGAFTLVEREHLNYIADELKLGQSGLVDPSTAPKVGRLAGAQYTVAGAITLYYYSEKASGFVLPILGISAKAKTAYVVIDIRIIDAETGEIVYAYEQTSDAINKEKKSLGSSSKVTGGLLELATRNAVGKHVSAMKGLNLEI